jgi:hypothetical protein
MSEVYPPPLPPVEPPPDTEEPPRTKLINVPETFTIDEMMDHYGAVNLFGLLGAVSANMDTVYHEVSQRLATDETGQLFKRWFGNVSRNIGSELATVKLRLGFAGGVMDNAYSRGAAAAGGGYHPTAIGKLSAVQEKWLNGEKPRDGDIIGDPPWKPYKCFWLEVDDDGTWPPIVPPIGGSISG